MKIIVLNSKEYGDKSRNYGDCVLIINKFNEMLVYDCGSAEHATKVKSYVKKFKCTKVIGVLSHNDSDHFDGFADLIDSGVIKKIYSICALRYVDDIQKAYGKSIDREEIKKLILKKYNNIKELSGYIADIYNDDGVLKSNIIEGVNIVGPDYEYAISVIVRAIFDSEPDSIDGDSVMNAASVCVIGAEGNKQVLLTGDSTFENISNLLKGVDFIQLPHHGRESQAKAIFEICDVENKLITYLVSDNTGDTNGGSDGRNFKGRNVISTKAKDMDIELNLNSYTTAKGTFGI